MTDQRPPDCRRYPGTPCTSGCRSLGLSDLCFHDLRPPPHDGVCTGMDIPMGEWTAADVAHWTGTERYQPWKDVAVLFREPR